MRSLLFSIGLLTTLAGASLAPACGAPGEDDADDSSVAGEDAYTTDGLCDGLPKLKSVKTPPGVCVGIVQTGFTFARGLAQTAQGDIVLAEMGGWAKDRGAVWLLHKNADKTWSKKRLMSTIDKPSGVAIGPDGLAYVGTPDNIFRFDPYTIDPRLGQPRLKVVVNNLPGDTQPNGTSGARHPLKKFIFDPHNPWTMYVNIGSASDVCEQGSGARPPTGFPMPCPEAETRGLLRKYVLDNADHTATTFTTYAKGLRNSMALAIHPTSGILVQGENSRDSINKLDANLTSTEGELPHEELNVITEGSSYGWPYCIDNGVPNPEYRGRVDCTNYKNPSLILPGHVSPLGMTYYTGSMFPAAYKNQLLVTFHGYREYGHRLMLVPVDANGYPGSGQPMDIIRGWEKTGTDPQGAPVDVMQASDGSIFLTEDKNGTVLRVFFDAAKGNGAPMTPLPPQHPVVSPDEAARCTALAAKNDTLSRFQRDVIDQACVSCHGAGPGYAGGLALLKCDSIGNAQRLTAARTGNRGPLVAPRDQNSELVKILKGDGFPQMPAGGVSPEQLQEVTQWISEGAPH